MSPELGNALIDLARLISLGFVLMVLIWGVTP